MSNTLYVFIAVTVLMSCQPDSFTMSEELDKPGTAYPLADERLWPFFAEFEKQAGLRGLQVDLAVANISGELIKIHENGIAGSCSYGGRQRNREVVIDKDFWNRASSNFREYIVFHELGHCYLFRDHLEDCLEAGIWASLMRSGTLNFCRDYYNSSSRDYYLDELFEGSTD